jgi:hypothetical protein
MRSNLILIVFTFHCARCLFAGQLSPLTVNEISLMLRSGYSSDTILRDLSTRHFADTINPAAEKQLIQANASPALLDALRNGNNAASEKELAQARQRLAEGRFAAQQAVSQRDAAEKAAAHSSSQIVVARDSAREGNDERARYAASPQGKREARAQWCAEHPTECALQDAQSAAASTRADLDTLKMQLFMNGITISP